MKYERWGIVLGRRVVVVDPLGEQVIESTLRVEYPSVVFRVRFGGKPGETQPTENLVSDPDLAVEYVEASAAFFATLNTNPNFLVLSEEALLDEAI